MPPLIPKPFPVAFLVSSFPFEQFPLPFSFYGGCIPLPGSVAVGNKQTDKGQPPGTVPVAPPEHDVAPSGQEDQAAVVAGAASATANTTKLKAAPGSRLHTHQRQIRKASAAPTPHNGTSALQEQQQYQHSLGETTRTLLLSQDFVHKRFSQTKWYKTFSCKEKASDMVPPRLANEG